MSPRRFFKVNLLEKFVFENGEKQNCVYADKLYSMGWLPAAGLMLYHKLTASDHIDFYISIMMNTKY